MAVRLLRLPAAVLLGALGGSGLLSAQTFVEMSANLGVVVPMGPSGPFGGGVLASDITGDGLPDIVAPGGAGSPIYVFVNSGGGPFIDATGTSGLPSGGPSKGIAGADIDNDGDLDLYLTRYWGQNALFLNLGNGTFQDITAASGTGIVSSSHAAAFGDFDRDGFVDLYVGTYAAGNRLYRNNGNLTFADVTVQAGVENWGRSFQVLFSDVDGDLFPDLFIANDRGNLTGAVKNTLYRNLGNGTFADISQAAGVAFGIDGMGVDAADLDHDGDEDLYVTNNTSGNLLHMNQHPSGVFLENAQAAGVAAMRFGWGTSFSDLDNDGDLDLYVCNTPAGVVTGQNLLFRNDASPGGPVAFTEIGVQAGVADPFPSYGLAVADFDGNGALDLLIADAPAMAKLCMNSASQNAWLGLRLTGTTSNRSAIGAVARVSAGGITRMRVVRAGSTFCSQSDLTLHFGLGGAAMADRIDITWPSGASQSLLAVPAGQILAVEEPSVTVTPAPAAGVVSAVIFRSVNDAGAVYIAGAAFSATPGIPLGDGRVIPLAADPLLQLTLAPGNPLTAGFAGVLPATGSAAGSLAVPSLPGITGVSAVLAFVVADAALSVPVRTISAPHAFTIP